MTVEPSSKSHEVALWLIYLGAGSHAMAAAVQNARQGVLPWKLHTSPLRWCHENVSGALWLYTSSMNLKFTLRSLYLLSSHMNLTTPWTMLWFQGCRVDEEMSVAVRSISRNSSDNKPGILDVRLPAGIYSGSEGQAINREEGWKAVCRRTKCGSWLLLRMMLCAAAIIVCSSWHQPI